MSTVFDTILSSFSQYSLRRSKTVTPLGDYLEGFYSGREFGDAEAVARFMDLLEVPTNENEPAEAGTSIELNA